GDPGQLHAERLQPPKGAPGLRQPVLPGPGLGHGRGVERPDRRCRPLEGPRHGPHPTGRPTGVSDHGQRAGWILPVTSPRLRTPPPTAGAVADSVTVSPSSRNDRVAPSGSVSGSAPFQLSSIRDPRWSGDGPETVPEAKRSPVRSEAPLTVR